MTAVSFCQAVLVRTRDALYRLSDPKPICAISPAGCKHAYNACLNESRRIGNLLLQAKVLPQSITVTYRNATGQLATMTLDAWPLARLGYYTDGDGSGILYRQKTTPNGTVLIQPLYMGMVKGGNEFDLIDTALGGTLAMYKVSDTRTTAIA